MTELPALLAEIADRAKTYDALDVAYVRGRRRRRVRDVAVPGPGRGAEITYLSDDARIVGGYRIGDDDENIAPIWRCA